MRGHPARLTGPGRKIQVENRESLIEIPDLNAGMETHHLHDGRELLQRAKSTPAGVSKKYNEKGSAKLLWINQKKIYL
jgi:hypothetical protein